MSALEQSYASAARTTAHWAKSFFFASRFLPAPKKRAVFALYDFCRHADNLVDERGDRATESVRSELHELADMVRATQSHVLPSSDRWLALHDTMQRFPIPVEPLIDLLKGVATDLDPVEFVTFGELHEYCRRVAGGVGLMLGPVLGASSDQFREHGVQLGVAMQLTNVLRDVTQDLALGRVYIPRDEMARFGVGRADLERGELTPQVRRMIAYEVARARQYFVSASVVVNLFPPDGSRLTVRLLEQTYAAILDEIERMDYDVFRRRAFTSRRRKLLILGRALLDEHVPGIIVPRAKPA